MAEGTSTPRLGAIGAPGESSSGAEPRLGLRTKLVVGDLVAFVGAAALTEVISGWVSNGAFWRFSIVRLIVAGTVGVVTARWQGLYQASRCALRSSEFTFVVRTAVILGMVTGVLDELVTNGADISRALVLAALTVVTLTFARGGYRTWLRAMRSRGRYLRPVILVGANLDAARIASVLADHPEAGYRLTGVCASGDDSLRYGLRHLWRGEPQTAADIIRRGEATGAFVVASALEPTELNDIVRAIGDAGGHVHLSSGLRGIDTGRLDHSPVVHEPLLHIQPRQFNGGQAIVKRVVDVSLASFLLLLTSPILIGSYLAVRLTDRGPGLFRQVRVGRDGRTFEVLKLRTMVVNAEQMVKDLRDGNERNGPLFKLENDPRVTKIGRLLRATSMDELPQLWNVIRGEMSLVGPRPALPSEVAAFPEGLRSRTNVLPGITGLWQVEARDNPSFEAYSRLDLFYVENWTVTFDLVIMVATVESEVARLLAKVLHRNQNGDMLEPDRPTVTEIDIVGAGPLSKPTRSTLVD